MKRQDLLTKEEFIPSRINQKFAVAKNRIKYHNNKANEFRHSIAYFKKPLVKNIKILDEIMNGKKEIEIHKQFLLGKGYSFGINSHVERFENKNHFAIHRYMVIPMPNEQLKIVKYKND